jgi:hypothetical protein
MPLPRNRSWLRLVATVAAWAWTLLAGLGGLFLLIMRGPLPLTNGWFALFSGVLACPLLPRLVKSASGRTVRWRVLLGCSAAIILAGRITLLFEPPRPPDPQPPASGFWGVLLG